uniref:Uncharacterized protein n=1 Tax=Trichogramma kaykai TaxID=54128 RepID=A0ABD2VXM4_9HYME
MTVCSAETRLEDRGRNAIILGARSNTGLTLYKHLRCTSSESSTVGTCDSDFSSSPYLWQWRRYTFSIQECYFSRLYKTELQSSDDCGFKKAIVIRESLIIHDFALSSIWRIRSWKIREAKASEKCGENETIKSERYSMHLFKNQVAALTAKSHYVSTELKCFYQKYT